jgi:hypothetical protein
MSNTSYEMSTTKTPGVYTISGLGAPKDEDGGEGSGEDDKPNLITMADGLFRHAFHDLVNLRGPFTLSSLTTDFPCGYAGGEIKTTIAITRKTRNLVFAGLEARVGDNIIMTASGLWSY